VFNHDLRAACCLQTPISRPARLCIPRNGEQMTPLARITHLGMGIAIQATALAMFAGPLLFSDGDMPRALEPFLFLAAIPLCAVGALETRRGLFTGQFEVREGGVVLEQPPSVVRRWGGPRWFVPRAAIVEMCIDGDCCYARTTVGLVRASSHFSEEEISRLATAGYRITKCGDSTVGKSLEGGSDHGLGQDRPRTGNRDRSESGSSRPSLAGIKTKKRASGAAALLTMVAGFATVVLLMGSTSLEGNSRFAAALAVLVAFGYPAMWLIVRGRLIQPLEVRDDYLRIPVPIYSGPLGGVRIWSPRTRVYAQEIRGIRVVGGRIEVQTVFGSLRVALGDWSSDPKALEDFANGNAIQIDRPA